MKRIWTMNMIEPHTSANDGDLRILVVTAILTMQQPVGEGGSARQTVLEHPRAAH